MPLVKEYERTERTLTLDALAELIRSQLPEGNSVEVILQPDNTLRIIQRKLLQEYEA